MTGHEWNDGDYAMLKPQVGTTRIAYRQGEVWHDIYGLNWHDHAKFTVEPVQFVFPSSGKYVVELTDEEASHVTSWYTLSESALRKIRNQIAAQIPKPEPEPEFMPEPEAPAMVEATLGGEREVWVRFPGARGWESRSSYAPWDALSNPSPVGGESDE